MAVIKSGKTTRRARQKPRKQETASYQRLDFSRKNWMIFAAGIASIVVGFLLLSLGDITIAPILLVGGYLGLIPWALVARSRPPEGSEVPATGADPSEGDRVRANSSAG